MAASRFRTTQGPVDVAVALFFTFALQLEIWIWWVPEEMGPRPLAAVMGILLTLPLLWRRRAPLACLAASMGVLLVWTLIAAPQGSLVPFLTTLVLVFSLAVHASAGPAAAGLAFSATVFAVEVASTTNSFGDYVFVGAFLVGSWLAGRAVRARQRRADELFDRTVRLEVEREEKAREAAANERTRIARELHDVISHSVSVMVVQAGAAEEVFDSDPDQARNSLRSIQETGRQARHELRRLLGLMRADGKGMDLAPQPGLAELQTLVQQLRQSGLDVDLDVRIEPRTLSPGLELAAYRIVQEALTNALKHGGPGRARVLVRHDGDALEVEVLDEGEAQGAGRGGGFGLIGMRERIALYGGELEHGRHNRGGYRLRARLPLNAGEQ
jgi:signal transduction histidine kinase